MILSSVECFKPCRRYRRVVPGCLSVCRTSLRQARLRGNHGISKAFIAVVVSGVDVDVDVVAVLTLKPFCSNW